MNWPKWLGLGKSEEPSRPEEKEESTRNMLTITMTDGTYLQLWKDDWVGEDFQEPYKEFIDWYLSPEETENYLFAYRRGVMLIRRSQIRSFKVELITA